MENINLELSENQIITLYKILATISDSGELAKTMAELTPIERLDIASIFESVLEEAINLEGFESKRYKDVS